MSEHSELGARASNYNSLRSLPEWLRAAVVRVRDQFALGDYNEAYHQLYIAFTPQGCYEPWRAMEGTVCNCVTCAGNKPSENETPAPSSNSKVYEDGELWSFIRRCMAQGKDIHLDHAERTYEEYSARLDVAALERLPELQDYIVRAVVAACGSNETCEALERENKAASDFIRGCIEAIGIDEPPEGFRVNLDALLLQVIGEIESLKGEVLEHTQKAGEPQCSGLCSGLPDANCPVHGLKATLSEPEQR